MNIYLLKQSDNNGYDTYDGVVVAAESEEEARKISPSHFGFDPDRKDWANCPENVRVELIGEAFSDTPRGVILASHNAG